MNRMKRKGKIYIKFALSYITMFVLPICLSIIFHYYCSQIIEKRVKVANENTPTVRRRSTKSWMRFMWWEISRRPEAENRWKCSGRIAKDMLGMIQSW